MRLLPLTDIPRSARDAERNARERYATAESGLQAASYCIQDAPGHYGNQPVVYGRVITLEAAEACAAETIHIRGAVCFPRAYRVLAG